MSQELAGGPNCDVNNGICFFCMRPNGVDCLNGGHGDKICGNGGRCIEREGRSRNIDKCYHYLIFPISIKES